jgi:Pentapeptide repeats (8 copies)
MILPRILFMAGVLGLLAAPRLVLAQPLASSDACLDGSMNLAADASMEGGMDGPEHDVPRKLTLHGDCAGCDLSGRRLMGADLAGSALLGVSARHADFRGADLSHARLSGGQFDAANFAGADLAHAELTAAVFDGADFSRASLDHADLRGADLSRARGLEQEQIDGACADLTTRLPPGLHPHECRKTAHGFSKAELKALEARVRQEVERARLVAQDASLRAARAMRDLKTPAVPHPATPAPPAPPAPPAEPPR